MHSVVAAAEWRKYKPAAIIILIATTNIVF
jgi:hypothetical protein